MSDNHFLSDNLLLGPIVYRLSEVSEVRHRGSILFLVLLSANYRLSDSLSNYLEGT
jgi:hypothetical protein